MIFNNTDPERRFLVPEVVQTSAMDCGPATLKCLLEGFGIPVSYGRLREACQTSVDGTSIDVMEEVAVQLGLDAEQVMVPADHLLMPETGNLPSIVVTILPSGMTHFIVAWRLHDRFVQVMDPGAGRRWRSRKRFLSELYIHTHQVPMQDWRDWAETDGFLFPLSRRMEAIGIEEPDINGLIEFAVSEAHWYPLAALDASVRMTDSVIRAGGVDKGAEAFRVVDTFLNQAFEKPENIDKIIPQAFWSVLPPEKETDESTLLLKGAVLVRVLGKTGESYETDEFEAEPEEPPSLSPELAAALDEKPSRPELEILRLLGKDGLLVPSVLILALAIAAAGMMIEVLIFRGLIDIGSALNLVEQRIGAATAIFVFVIGLLLLEIPSVSVMLRMGRRLETRLRIAFLEKIPRLGDRYFHSRLTSDMTMRAHELRGLEDLPMLGVRFFSIGFQIIFTAAGIIFFIPESAWIAVLATIFEVGVSFAAQPIMMEQDLRLRTQLSALSRYYLDALLGLVPIRTHCAQRAIRREHENVMVEWVRTGMDFLKAETVVRTIEALAGAGFSIWIVFNYIGKGGSSGGILLLLYWTLNLPVLGKSMADFALQYPMHRSRILRLLEPLNAPEEEESFGVSEDGGKTRDEPEEPDDSDRAGIAIAIDNVSVKAGGHTILSDVTTLIRPGEHIAVVGPSGAGKSSLVGLLLGWHRPSTGGVRTDGKALTGKNLQILRRETAWVDPSVLIWNKTFYENLRYGSRTKGMPDMTKAIEAADLFTVLERMPNGLQTPMGEGGGFVSGGEGQRVRLGRAILRGEIRLAILDEPFRGLDREKRRQLLVSARERWRDATLIFISHDVGESLGFDRVLVIENGRLVEDDAPSKLADMPDSRYRVYLESERDVRTGLWESPGWRRFWMEDGHLEEKTKAERDEDRS